METPNAFIGKVTQPSETEVAASLGSTAALWEQLVDWLAERGAAEQEWKSSSAKYGWSLLLKLKRRTIVYLIPSVGCFRVAFALGDRAVEAARKGDLSKSTLKIIEDSPHYAEGTGVRLVVKTPKDLAAIRKLALIKLAN
jgi:hypothetical protein